MNYRFAKLNGLNFYKLLKNMLISGKRDALLIPEANLREKILLMWGSRQKEILFPRRKLIALRKFIIRPIYYIESYPKF